jgi:SpoVK/Ycf46/Vps4 family AAA+-type ATPase
MKAKETQPMKPKPMSKPEVITSSKQSYLDAYEILSASAVGVILTRTREPHRAEAALREWAFGRSPARTFKNWNCIRGWREIKPDVRSPAAVPDKSVDIYLALQKIADVQNNGASPWMEGVFVMHYPQWVLPKHGGVQQLLKEYSRDFTETKQRLVLIAPEGFTLPLELQNDILVLDFALPLKDELREVYDNVIDAALETSGQKAPYAEEEISMLLSSGAGMTEQEFETALSQSIITNKAQWPKVPIGALDAVVRRCKTDVVKRSEILELMPSVDMAEVGGLDLAKKWITKRQKCFSQEARDFGVDVPKGIAAIGPPGTGKSLLAKAISGLLSLPLIKFDVAKVFDKYVGGSESKAESALNQIEAMAPCVCLIDEIDKGGLDPKQGGGDSGTSMRVLGKILTRMQETKSPIFWVFTANRAHGLDPALLRKGRLDEVFAVLPPNKDERMQVLHIHLRKRKQNPAKVPDLDIAVEVSEGFVSAEIEAAVSEAILESFCDEVPVTGKLIAKQFGNMKPISIAFKEDFDYMKTWAEQNARMASSPDKQAGAVRVRRRSLDQD